MKKLLWAVFLIVFMTIGLNHGVPVAYAAAPPSFKPTLVVAAAPVTVNGITCRYQMVGVLPTSTSKAKFTLWQNMNPYTFHDGTGSYVEQCRLTIGELPWLTAKVCEDFEKSLQEGRCAVAKDVNYIDLDVVRGKKDGRSTAFLYEAMQLKEQRQAIFVQLPDQKWVGVFAGQPKKSCNNFFGIDTAPQGVDAKGVGSILPVARTSPPVVTPPVTPPVISDKPATALPPSPAQPSVATAAENSTVTVTTVVVTPSERHLVPHTGWVGSGIIQQQSSPNGVWVTQEYVEGQSSTGYSTVVGY